MEIDDLRKEFITICLNWKDGDSNMRGDRLDEIIDRYAELKNIQRFEAFRELDLAVDELENPKSPWSEPI